MISTDLLTAEGRKPGSVRRSLMTGLRFSSTQKALDDSLAARKQTAEELRGRGIVVGAGEEVKVQLAELEQAGLQRVMLQWMDLDDLDGLAALAKAVL